MIEDQAKPVEVEVSLSQEEINSIKKRSISGIISYFLRTIILQGIGLAAAFVLSKFFIPEDFAVYGFVVQIIGLLTFFSDIGLAAALVQKKLTPSDADYKTAFTMQQILSWLIFGVIVVIILSDVISVKYGSAANWILFSLGLSFPLATLKTIPSIILERKLDFNKLVIPQIFEQLIFQVLLIYLAWKGIGAMSYTYAILARSVLGVVVMSFLQRWPFGFALDKQSIKSLIGFGFKFQLNDLLARIKDQLFYLLVGLFIPVKDFGYLNWSKNWSMYPYNLTVQNVMAVTFPTFSRLQNNPAALTKAINKSIFFITLAIFPIIAGMCLFISPLTDVVYDYSKWKPAIPSFIFFAISIGWAALSTPLVNTLNAIGKINQSLKLMIMWTVLTWVLTPILVKVMGFDGVAFASLIISFTSVFSIIMVKREVTISVWENIWRQLVATAIMVVVGIAGQTVWSRDFYSFLTGFVVVGSTYILAVLLLGYKKLFAEFKSMFGK
ncbi:MAG: oligosaccharide flippase family protein [Patescibacteria group bacterium]